MGNGEVLEVSADGMRRLTLHVDETPANPRTEYDQLTHVITLPSSRYIDVDRDPGPYGHIWQHLWDRYSTYRSDPNQDAPSLFQRAVRMLGGVSLLRTPHEGPVTIWYLTPEDIETEGAGDTPEARALWALNLITAEATEYQQWAEGDVYGYVIEQRNDWERNSIETRERETMEAWSPLDSCWGFYGYEYAAEEARSEWASWSKDQAPAPVGNAAQTGQ